MEAARRKWHIECAARAYRAGDVAALHGRMGDSWLSATRKVFPSGGGHLDLGCGAGRMTFALADLWSSGGWSVGADRNDEALAEAETRAREENLATARFVRLDVEKEDYAPLLRGMTPDLITAHLCMGHEIARRAAAALAPGGIFAFAALHPDLWKESGFTSRFALPERSVESILDRFDLSPLFLRVEKEILEFESPPDLLDGYFRNGETVPGWRSDGRWDALQEYVHRGGRTLTTRAQCQCVAQKVSP
jgi:SAM-dependent methyltransferase